MPEIKIMNVSQTVNENMIEIPKYHQEYKAEIVKESKFLKVLSLFRKI